MVFSTLAETKLTSLLNFALPAPAIWSQTHSIKSIVVPSFTPHRMLFHDYLQYQHIVLVERPVRVICNFPIIAVRVGKISAIPAPENLLRRFCNNLASRTACAGRPWDAFKTDAPNASSTPIFRSRSSVSMPTASKFSSFAQKRGLLYSQNW